MRGELESCGGLKSCGGLWRVAKHHCGAGESCGELWTVGHMCNNWRVVAGDRWRLVQTWIVEEGERVVEGWRVVDGRRVGGL